MKKRKKAKEKLSEQTENCSVPDVGISELKLQVGPR